MTRTWPTLDDSYRGVVDTRRTNDRALRALHYRGYMLRDNQVWLIINDDADNWQERLVCDQLDDVETTYLALRKAEFPRHEGEIPCVECGRFVNTLDTYCPLCAIPETADLSDAIRTGK